MPKQVRPLSENDKTACWHCLVFNPTVIRAFLAALTLCYLAPVLNVHFLRNQTLIKKKRNTR